MSSFVITVSGGLIRELLGLASIAVAASKILYNVLHSITIKRGTSSKVSDTWVFGKPSDKCLY